MPFHILMKVRIAHQEQTLTSLAVRTSIGMQLAMNFWTDYRKAFSTVEHFLATNASLPTGLATYEPSIYMTQTIQGIFQDLKLIRSRRQHGEEAPTAYTNQSKTVVVWFSRALMSAQGVQYLHFFPLYVLAELFEMVDIKEDPGLVTEASTLIMLVTGDNLSYPEHLLKPMVDAIEQIATSLAWRHRWGILGFFQIFYYRHIFALSAELRQRMTRIAVNLLSDPRAEVRARASATLTGIVQCSLSSSEIQQLAGQFRTQLKNNPRPPRLILENGISSPHSSGRSTPSNLVPGAIDPSIQRHGGILGLCSLIKAFPYGTPPAWLPSVIAFLSREAANDPGLGGKTVRDVLGSFKKTRVDTWQYDQKVFSEDELEMLEGSGPSYIA